MDRAPWRGVRNVLVSLAITLLVAVSGDTTTASAHPGNTDSSGCHTCRTNCASWGRRPGEYHCHGGGSGGSGGRAPAPPAAPPPPPAIDEAAVRPQLTRLYLAYFERQPDVAGLDHWVGRMRAGLRLGDVSQQFTQSPEFVSTYGPALTSGDFVKLVYRNVLDREPDAGGYAYWAPLVEARAVSRGALMVNFSESAEFKARTGTG